MNITEYYKEFMEFNPFLYLKECDVEKRKFVTDSAIQVYDLLGESKIGKKCDAGDIVAILKLIGTFVVQEASDSAYKDQQELMR